MKCRQAQELMGAYLYGDLAPEEMRELRVHAQDCALCREDLATRGRGVSCLNDAVPTLSDADRQRIAWSVKGAVRKQEAKGRPLILRLIPALGMAAVVLAAGFVAGRLATRSPQQTARAHKAYEPPRAKIEVKETTPDPSKTSNVPNEMIDVLRSVFGTAATADVNRASEPGSRYLPGRTSTQPHPDTTVKAVPEQKHHHSQQHPQAAQDTAGPVKDSTGGTENSQVETGAGTTKLPQVTGQKNAETTPSGNK